MKLKMSLRLILLGSFLYNFAYAEHEIKQGTIKTDQPHEYNPERDFIKQYSGVKVIQAFEYNNVIELYNADTHVLITPDFGAKIMSYRYKSKELLMTDPSDNGFQYDPVEFKKTKKITAFNSGARFDIGNAEIHRNRQMLLYGKWTAEIIGDRRVRLTSQFDPERGLVLSRTYHLSEDGSELELTFTMINASEQVQKAHFWTRMFADGGGVFIKPLTPPTFFPNNYVINNYSGTQLLPPYDNNVLKTDDYIVVTGQPNFNKFGFDSYAGWHAYISPTGLLFCGTYPTYPNKQYSDVVGGTYSLYYNTNFKGRSVAELEPISPQYILQPGEKATFWEIWRLAIQELPENTTNVASIIEQVRAPLEKMLNKKIP